MVEQTCIRCKKTFPATAEYFNRTKAAKSGLYAYCKACSKEKVQEWQRNHPERMQEYRRKARATDPDRVKGYSRTHRERKKAKLEQLLKEKDARIAELEAQLRALREVTA